MNKETIVSIAGYGYLSFGIGASIAMMNIYQVGDGIINLPWLSFSNTVAPVLLIGGAIGTFLHLSNRLGNLRQNGKGSNSTKSAENK